MSAMRRARGRSGGGILGFLGGAVVASVATVAGFTVFSGVTDLPERPAIGVGEGAQADRSAPSAPQPAAGSIAAPAPSGAAPAPAPRAAGGVAAPRPSGGTAPDAQAPAIAGTESSGIAGLSGPSAPTAGTAPSLPGAPSVGAPAGLAAPSAPGGGAPAGGAAFEPPAIDPDATPEEKREQLAALLGEAPAAPGGEAPAAPAPAPVAPTPDIAAVPAGDAPATAAPEAPETAAVPAAEPEPEPERAPEPPAPVLALAGPAIEVNARAMELPAGTKALAIVLSDAGEPGGLSADLLSGIPFPVTVGILAGTEGAAALAAAARAAGHEVLVQLPTEAVEGRVAADAALLPGLEGDAAAARVLTLLAGLPDGVAVSTWPAAAPQGAGTEALMAVLAEHGFGYLENRSFAAGAIQRSAREAGVPFAAADKTIQRRATPTQLAQQIGQAAGDAGRGGPQVVIIPATADALKAAVEWSLQNGGVRPVPLSTVLKARAG